ncbi:MAG: histidine kinase [Acidimicrobiaceae bacterium]|nr:histidine kinase [Acidimicrobiaceae bacterium]
MRARITLAVVIVLAGALLLAGAVSLTLVRRAATANAQATVLRQAGAVTAHASVAAEPGVSVLLGQTAGVTTSVVEVEPNGAIHSVQPPLAVPNSRLDGKVLASGKPVSGVAGPYAFAVVPLKEISGGTLGGGGGIVLALALQSQVADSFASVGYFLLAGGVSLLVAAGVVAVIARRISRRVVAASAAAQRIASGDLDSRMPVSRRDYPELAGLDRSINTMAENLARARIQERQFLLSISHELRTPLTSIRGYAEAIRDGAVEQVGRAAGVVVAEATRLERLIGDLLDLAKLEARQFRLEARPSDLAAVVAAAGEALRLELEAVGVALEVFVPFDALAAIADPDRIGQVLANLVENALKYARSKVVIRLDRDGPRAARLSVEDDGPGISPDDLPHIFDRLFTSGRHEARSAGSGLGLAIVAELAEAMGGSVDAASPLGPDGGTRICVSLPLSGAPLED